MEEKNMDGGRGEEGREETSKDGGGKGERGREGLRERRRKPIRMEGEKEREGLRERG